MNNIIFAFFAGLLCGCIISLWHQAWQKNSRHKLDQVTAVELTTTVQTVPHND